MLLNRIEVVIHLVQEKNVVVVVVVVVEAVVATAVVAAAVDIDVVLLLVVLLLDVFPYLILLLALQFAPLQSHHLNYCLTLNYLLLLTLD